MRAGRCCPEITGSGGALVDVDGDGDLDIYLVQAGSLYDEPAPPPPGNRLFINEGGRFAPAPDANGADDSGYGMGVAAGDYDNDGDVDLYVTNVGPNVLYRNDGAGRLEDVTAKPPGWPTPAGARRRPSRISTSMGTSISSSPTTSTGRMPSR